MKNEKDLEVKTEEIFKTNEETKEETKESESKEDSVKCFKKDKKKKLLTKKQKLKKTVIIVISVFLVLGILVGVAPTILRWIRQDSIVEFDTDKFYEPDYEKNIFEDDEYMSLRRGVYYKRDGREVIVTPETRGNLHQTAGFFYDYINCIIRGDYGSYPSFYTEKCKSDPNFKMPEKFTMQGLYEIHIEFMGFETNEAGEPVSELYYVDYRIYENNGTYRRDILPDEPRTRIFEVTLGNDPKINSITYIKTVKD